VTAMLVRFSCTFPVLSRVIWIGAPAVPTGLFPKATGDGERRTPGAVATPLPVNGSLSGLVAALLRTLMFADRAPTPPGVNVALKVQLAPAARLLAPNAHGEVPAAESPKSPALVPVTVMLVRFN
jgi:hypothetical protein